MCGLLQFTLNFVKVPGSPEPRNRFRTTTLQKYFKGQTKNLTERTPPKGEQK